MSQLGAVQFQRVVKAKYRNESDINSNKHILTVKCESIKEIDEAKF